MNIEGLKKCEVKLFKLNTGNVNSCGSTMSSTSTTTAASEPLQKPLLTLDILKKQARQKQPIVLLPRMILNGSKFTRIPLSKISMESNKISIQSNGNDNLELVNVRRSFRLTPQIIKELHQIKRPQLEPDNDRIVKKPRNTASNNNGITKGNVNENSNKNTSNNNNGAKKGKKCANIVDDNQFLGNCRGCLSTFDDEESLRDHEEVCVKTRLIETDVKDSTVDDFCKYFDLVPNTTSTKKRIDNGPLAYDPNIEIPHRLRTNRVQLTSYFRNNPVPISCFRGKIILFGDKAIGKITEPAERLVRDYELYCGTQVKRVKPPISSQIIWPVVKTRRVQKMLNSYSHKYSFTANERIIRNAELTFGLGVTSWHLLGQCKQMKIVVEKLPEYKNEALMKKRLKLLEKLKKGEVIPIYGKIPIIKLYQLQLPE